MPVELGEDKACQLALDTFFPPNEEDVRLNETQCKRICHQCPAIEGCLTNALEYASVSRSVDYEGEELPLVGVFGGTNQWERQWLLSADTEQIEDLKVFYAEVGHEGALQWRIAIEEDSPGMEVCQEAEQAEDLAREWAVPLKLARRWRARNGCGNTIYPRWSKWRTAMLLHLADGEWCDRKSIIAAGAAMVPDEDARKKTVKQQRSLDGAKKAIANNTLWLMVEDQAAVLEEKREDGERLLRIVPDKRAKVVSRAQYESEAWGVKPLVGAANSKS